MQSAFLLPAVHWKPKQILVTDMQRLILPLIIILLLILCLCVRRGLEESSRPTAGASSPERIVSLAPSITETLFAVGLGAKVVGVTQFCAYPPNAAALPKVAGFSDVSFEALLRVRPDLVVMPADKTVNKEQIERLGIRVLTVEVTSLEGLTNAILSLSSLSGNKAAGEKLIAQMKNRMAWAAERAKGKKSPSVLFSVMHSEQDIEHISEISAIGRDGFYDQLIGAAGGRNVYEGLLPYPRLSREAIIFLNPDVIIDVLPSSENEAAARRGWMSLTSVNAIKNGRLLILTDEMHTVPGPRFVKTLEAMSLAFHPEAEKETRDE